MGTMAHNSCRVFVAGAVAVGEQDSCCSNSAMAGHWTAEGLLVVAMVVVVSLTVCLAIKSLLRDRSAVVGSLQTLRFSARSYVHAPAYASLACASISFCMCLCFLFACMHVQIMLVDCPTTGHLPSNQASLHVRQQGRHQEGQRLEQRCTLPAGVLLHH